jgi:ribosomal protein S18 acetylase RimI-like enzyme
LVRLYWSEVAYEDEIKRDDSIALVAKIAKNSKNILGFIMARLITIKPITETDNNISENGFIERKTQKIESEIEIYNLTVKREFRRNGIAWLLLKRCLELSQRKGDLTVWLDVRETNSEALAFYQKMGFEILYKRKNFYRKPLEDAVVMSFRAI